MRRASRCFEPLASTIRVAAMETKISVVDNYFRTLLVLSKIFKNSWGDPKFFEKAYAFRKSVMEKGAVMEVVERMKPRMFVTKEVVKKEVKYLEGWFESPLVKVFPEILSGNIGKATWRGMFPKLKKGPLVIHLAGTGDHSFYRREVGFANDLIKQNVSSILLQNPYYGSRRPKQQFRSSLLNVSDLFMMGGALMAECNYLLDWSQKLDYRPVGLAGVSMGGHMVSLACTNSPWPVSVVPCLSWTTAAPVFVKGALSRAIPWNVLNEELMSRDFQNAIRKIPDCDWIDRAYEMERKNCERSSFGLAKQFMYILMEEFTNLGKYPKPVDPTLVKSVIAECDGYIVTNGVPSLQEVWPGAQVEVLKDMGHFTAYFGNHSFFRRCIMEMLNRNERLYC